MDEMGWYDDLGQGSEREHSRPPTRQALRLTFQFDGDNIELVSTQRLRKLVPPMVGNPPEEGRHYGEWLQVRDGDDRLLFTRLLNDPLRTRVEVHDPDSGPHIVVGPPGRGIFDVLVPDLPEASTAVLYASPMAEGRALRPAVPIGRFDLRRPDAEQGSAS